MRILREFLGVSFAFVLSRVANADHEVSADEVTSMEALVAGKGGVPADQAVSRISRGPEGTVS